MTRIVFGTEELEPTASNFKRAWEMYAAPAMMSDAKLVFAAYEAQLAEKDARIAELEADCIRLRAERVGALEQLAKHKPKFEVGDTVEYGHYDDAVVKAVRTVYDLQIVDGGSTYGVATENLRVPKPKVTKPTAEEWYEAFCGEQNGDFKEMVKLARRHEATQTEVAK